MLVILDLAARTCLCAFHIEIHMWGRQAAASTVPHPASPNCCIAACIDAIASAPGGSYFLLAVV